VPIPGQEFETPTLPMHASPLFKEQREQQQSQIENHVTGMQALQ